MPCHIDTIGVSIFILLILLVIKNNIKPSSFLDKTNFLKSAQIYLPDCHFDLQNIPSINDF